MKAYSLLYFFALAGVAFGFDENIKIDSYGKCIHEIRSFDFKTYATFAEPHSAIHIPAMKYNDANDDEILRTVFYFRGKADFSVVLSKKDNVSEKGPYFQTLIMHSNNETASIFLEPFTNVSKKLKKCDEIEGITNMFNNVYFEKLTLIVKKKGIMYWYIPNRSAPLLTCKSSSLKDVEYISFSGYDSRPTDVYFSDCPNA